MKRLILTLIRMKLGIFKGDKFRFANQRSKEDYYYFTDTGLMKAEYIDDFKCPNIRPANVALNWLIDDNCVIRMVEE